MRTKPQFLGLCLAGAIALLGCSKQPPAEESDLDLVDPTEQLPARFKTFEEVARPDFSAAAASPEFQQAIEDAAALLGAQPRPLGSEGQYERVTGGVAFAVSHDEIEALLFEAHRKFLARGFYLFRCEQHFGIGGDPDIVGLLPTNDKFAVMAAMGTNGANYGIGTAGVIAWMKELEQEQTYVLTGIGFDYMEGRFTGPVKNRDTLARRMYRFCPDIVDQGVETVEELAKELRTGHLFFWWD